MLKYVRFIHTTEPEVFAFTLAPLSHRNLANAMQSFGYQPASAAFVRFDQDGTAHVSGESESLKLKPDLGDAAKIGGLYRVMEKMSAPAAIIHTPGDDAIAT